MIFYTIRKLRRPKGWRTWCYVLRKKNRRLYFIKETCFTGSNNFRKRFTFVFVMSNQNNLQRTQIMMNNCACTIIEACLPNWLRCPPRDIKTSFPARRNTANTATATRTAVRQTGVSRHHGGQIEGPLKALGSSQHYSYEGFEEGPQMCRHFAERRQSPGQP